MISGPSYAVILFAENAVNKIRSLVGATDPAQAKLDQPNSIRAIYGTDILKNGIHCPSRNSSAAIFQALFSDQESI